MSIVLAAVMALTLFSATALADSLPQPEGGEKFEGNWGKMNGLVEIFYEEEGYRATVDLFNEVDGTGTLWEYACFYNEEKDVLESFSSFKSNYTLDTDTMYRALGDYEYEGIDDEGTTTVFSLTEDGALVWEDGHENMGQDLEFRDIGDFEGVWRNDEEEVYTEFWWQGLYDENTYFYSVYIHRGGEEQYADYHMEGLYDPETGKLEAVGTVTTSVLNADGSWDVQEDDEPCDAIFSVLGDGMILYETENGIELEYDLLGPES